MVAAALDLVDRDGVKGLTMRALGRALDVDPMAIYHHVPNKAAILDGVVEAVWSELELPEGSSDPWQGQVEQIARAMRDTLRRHPNALPIMATRANLSTAGFRLSERALGVVLDAGLPPGDALAFVNATAEFLFGHALSETSPQRDDDLIDALHAALASGDFPHIATTLAQVNLEAVTPDSIFESGIDTLIAGLERRLSHLPPDDVDNSAAPPA